MKIVGLGGSLHDFSAALAEDGRILVAIEEERLSRKRHGIDKSCLTKAIENQQLWKFPGSISLDTLKESVKYCLDAVAVNEGDIDAFCATDSNFYLPYLRSRSNVFTVNHHIAHAASAFYPSPFSEAAILVIDGKGSRVALNDQIGEETVTLAVGQGLKIEVIDKHISNSVGHFYEAVTMGLGFSALEEGKTMGLAPWGSSRYLPMLDDWISLEPSGRFSFKYDEATMRRLIKNVVGAAPAEEQFQVRADLAFAAQKILERIVEHLTIYLYKITKMSKLCLAGGVALNSVANGKIVSSGPFSSLFVQPASGDNGLSIGAALFASHVLGKEDRPSLEGGVSFSPYLGRLYSDEEIISALKEEPGLRWQVSPDICRRAAEYLASGKIIGWFQGRSEFGPRALGNRSILADPRDPCVKDILNRRVKLRESFRPFAPAVLAEFQKEYIELKERSPYMLLVGQVRPEKRDEVPAITHVDGSARIQSVSYEENSRLYELLRAFHGLTGIPMILNTSFNIRGEPIVETPRDAVGSFMKSDLDLLVVGNFIVDKGR